MLKIRFYTWCFLSIFNIIPFNLYFQKVNFTALMKDIIWTLIIVWFIFKIVALFKKKSINEPVRENHDSPKQTKINSEKIRSAVNSEGEYVDYEEIH
jgi:hypothetical protein